MVKIHPKQISGNWREGFALDLHTISSEYIGDDEYGHPKFDTKYSEMGELLYRLKYKKDESVLDDIITTTSQFIKSKNWPVDLVVPVPPSRKGRKFQPVSIVAEGIATALGIDISSNCVVKVKYDSELKNIFDFEKRLCILKDAFEIRDPVVVGLAVLLFDDLYRSGATLSEVSKILKEEGKVRDLYVITLTKTRSKR
ncbi:MAG TPA: ComF family protein [archaeon]|nr:ComF family protein [archaeon]